MSATAVSGGRHRSESLVEGHGVAASSEGITNPSIDELLEVVETKYGLVSIAAKRARQINAYYAQLGEGLLEYVGPLVETQVQEKPLSIALRETRDCVGAEVREQWNLAQIPEDALRVGHVSSVASLAI